jgi:hypothetical protein
MNGIKLSRIAWFFAMFCVIGYAVTDILSLFPYTDWLKPETLVKIARSMFMMLLALFFPSISEIVRNSDPQSHRQYQSDSVNYVAQESAWAQQRKQRRTEYQAKLNAINDEPLRQSDRQLKIDSLAREYADIANEEESGITNQEAG